MNGGNGNRGRIQLKIGLQQLICRCKYRNAVLFAGFSGARRVRIDRSHQRDTMAGAFKFAVNAEMVAAKGPRSGYGYAQNGFSRYRAPPAAGSLPSTAFRQRP